MRGVLNVAKPQADCGPALTVSCCDAEGLTESEHETGTSARQVERSPWQDVLARGPTQGRQRELAGSIPHEGGKEEGEICVRPSRPAPGPVVGARDSRKPCARRQNEGVHVGEEMPMWTEPALGGTQGRVDVVGAPGDGEPREDPVAVG